MRSLIPSCLPTLINVQICKCFYRILHCLARTSSSTVVMVTDELWGLQGILNSTAYERMRPNGSLLFHVRVGHGRAGKYGPALL